MLTPASVQSGKALERRVDETALVERHSALAENLLPWIAVLTVAAAALLWVRRRERREPDSGDRAVSPPRTSGAQRVRVAIVAIALDDRLIPVAGVPAGTPATSD